MAAAYPFALRTFLRDSKNRSQPAAFRIAQPRRGQGYVDPSGTDTPIFWDVQLCFTKAEAAQFRLFFTQDLQRGTLPFTIPIDTEFGLQTYEVQFLPESLLPAKQQGGVWMYTATVMARAELIPADALTDYADGSTVTVPDQYLIRNVPFTLSLSAFWPAGTGPFTWSQVAGTLPTGLALNSTSGVISGTPSIVLTWPGLVFRRTGAYGAPKDSSAATFYVDDPDALFSSVLLLLNNQSTVTKDSGPSNRTLTTATTAPTLDAAQKLFGYSTYKTPTAADGYIGIASDTFIPTACTNQEWCVETWARMAGAGADARFSNCSRFELKVTSAGTLTATCADIGASSYGLTSSAGACSLNNWHHIALVRDKTNGASDFLKLYLDGVLIQTSSAITKSAVVGTSAGFGRILGYNSAGAYGNFSNYRFTAGVTGAARYYANFTPPTRPFPSA